MRIVHSEKLEEGGNHKITVDAGLCVGEPYDSCSTGGTSESSIINGNVDVMLGTYGNVRIEKWD